jgi:hypothetical protein
VKSDRAAVILTAASKESPGRISENEPTGPTVEILQEASLEEAFRMTVKEFALLREAADG